MSWLFGKKKRHKDSPPDSTEEEQSSSQSDGFDIISMPPAMPMDTSHNAAATHSSSNLYPYVPPVPNFGQGLPPELNKDYNQGENAPHYLNGVPFKLCKRLEINTSNDFEIDSLRISEILSFIERIENRNYDYSFSLEESIMAEMNSRSDE